MSTSHTRRHLLVLVANAMQMREIALIATLGRTVDFLWLSLTPGFGNRLMSVKLIFTAILSHECRTTLVRHS